MLNFVDPIETRKAHEALVYDVNREMRYISTKYSVQIGTLYFEWDKLISTLDKHFPDILEEILNCDHQRDASAYNQGQSIPANSSKLNTNFKHGVTQIEGKYKGHPAPDFCN